MQVGKPGRVVFWVSILCLTIGWTFACYNAAVQNNIVAVFAALAMWAAGAFFGGIWIVVKVWQILCRVRYSERAAISPAPASSQAGPGASAPWGWRTVLSGIGVGLAVCLTGYLALANYGFMQEYQANGNKAALPPAASKPYDGACQHSGRLRAAGLPVPERLHKQCEHEIANDLSQAMQLSLPGKRKR